MVGHGDRLTMPVTTLDPTRRCRGVGSGARRRVLDVAVVVPLLFLGVFFAWPVAVMVGRGSSSTGTWTWRVRRRVLAAPHVADRRADARAGDPRDRVSVLLGVPGAYVLYRHSFPGPVRRARARHRAVRPADRRGRRRVPLAARRGRPARVPAPRRHVRGHRRRARVLQLRGRRAHRRWAVGAPRPARRAGGPRARRVALAGVPHRHAARADPRDRLRRVAGVPVLRDRVRHGARPRWAAVRHDRDRDLDPDHAVPRPARRRRAVGRAARRRRGALVVAGRARSRRERALAYPAVRLRPSAAAAPAGGEPPGDGHALVLGATAVTALVVVLLALPLVNLVVRSLRTRRRVEPRPLHGARHHRRSR